MPHLANMNLNGCIFDDFAKAVLSLKTLPALRSLFINLHEEEQVDFIMRTLTDLEFLNGLKVERDILEEEMVNAPN